MGRLGKFTLLKWAGRIGKTALSIVTIVASLLGTSTPTNRTETQPPPQPVQKTPEIEICSLHVTANGDFNNNGEINLCTNKQTTNFLNENFWLSSSINDVDVVEQGQISIAGFRKTGETTIDLLGTSNPAPSVTGINFSIDSPGLSQYLSPLLPQQSASSQSAPPSINEPSGDWSGGQLVESGDTFFTPWTLAFKPGTSLSGFLLSGLPGKTVSTRKFNFLEGTPSSAIGSDVTATRSSDSSVCMLAPSRNSVALDSTPLPGDTSTDPRWSIESILEPSAAPVRIPEPSAGAECVLLVLGLGWLKRNYSRK
jgi:hypothetical protein